MSRSPFLLAAVLAALAVTACTKQAPEFVANDQVPADQRTAEATEGEGGTEEPAGDVAGTWLVEGADLVFDDAPDTLPAGTVTIALQNDSGLVHNVVFEGVANDQPIVEVTGETGTGTVELPPGELVYYCSVPGHRPAGMEGTVIVE